jgi:hypothetical protein
MFGIPEFITKIIRVEQLFLGAGNGQMGTRADRDGRRAECGCRRCHCDGR